MTSRNAGGGPPTGPPAAESDELARLLERRGLRRDPDGARRLWRAYREAVRRAARPGAPGGPAQAGILRTFASLYRPAGPSRQGLGWALRIGVPRMLRAEMRWVGWAALIYAAVCAAAAVAAASSPAWQAALLPAATRASLQASLRSGLRPAHAAAASLSVMLFFHNIAACALAYAGGVLVGLGAVATLAANAALLGALAGWMAAHGVVAGFWALIAPHGALELPATFCAGGGGLAMGAAWLAPGDRPRLSALFAAARRTAPLFGAAVVLLAGAALVEGLFTPQPLPAPLKLGVAGALLLSLLGYVLRGGGTGRESAAPGTAPGAEGTPAAEAHGPLLARLRRLTAGARARGTAGPPDRRAAPGRSGGAGWLAVRLPEGLLLRLPRAGVPSRALAMAVDTAILALGLLGTVAGIAIVHPPGLAGWMTAAAAVFSAALVGLYWFLFEWLGGGATPGKRALGLRVLRDDGRPPGAWPALARNLLRVVDVLPTAYLLGAGVALATGGSRLGDLAGGTVVVHAAGLPEAVRSGAPPLPALHGPASEPDRLRRVPARARARLYRSWRRWCRLRDARTEEALLAALRAAGEPSPAGAGAATGAGAAAAEHLLAALHRAGLLRGRRFAPAPPRDRSTDLGALCPAAGTLEQLPSELAAAVQTFWARRAAMDGPAVARNAASLGGRLAAALGAPALAADDPEALVEHVAHALLAPERAP